MTERIDRVRRHLHPGPTAAALPASASSPDTHKAGLRWDGWGFADTGFILNDKGQVELRGNRFDHVLDGGATFEAFRAWAETEVGLELEYVMVPA